MFYSGGNAALVLRAALQAQVRNWVSPLHLYPRSTQLSDHEVNFMLGNTQFLDVPHSITAGRVGVGWGGQPLKRYPDISWGSVPLGPPLSLPAAGRNQQLKQQHLLSLRLLPAYTCIGNAWKSHFSIALKACFFFLPFFHQLERSKAITDNAWGGCFLRTSCQRGEGGKHCVWRTLRGEKQDVSLRSPSRYFYYWEIDRGVIGCGARYRSRMEKYLTFVDVGNN